MSDLLNRINELKSENRKLKQQIETLENRILALSGTTIIEASGEGDDKGLINNKIIEIMQTTNDQLNIVSPIVDEFYALELKKAAQRGVPILLITRDRHLLDKPLKKIYDGLKKTDGISLINNPNVTYLLVFNTELAIYSGGSLNNKELSRSILIITTILEDVKIRKIASIFKAMLPSFMR